MSTDTTSQDTTTPSTPPEGAPAAPTDASAASTPPAGGETSKPTESEGDRISRLEAELKSARAEAGKARVTAKQNAADEARKDLAQQIGKALGLVQDEPVDPAKLTEQLTEATADSRQAKTELAVFRAAAGGDADPVALLDSRTFLESVKDIDPADSKALGDAITAAVKANPRLARTAPSAGMRPNQAQGASASPPMNVNEQIDAAHKAGNLNEVMRLKSQQLLNTNQ